MNESVFVEMRKNMAEILCNMIMGDASDKEVKDVVYHTSALIDAIKALKYYAEKYPSKKED